MPCKLKVVVAYGIGHIKACGRNSILGTCKIYCAMFRAKTKGGEREGLRWIEEENTWENKGKSG